MNRHLLSARRLAAIVLLLGAVPNLAAQALPTRLQPLFASTKTICFGRFVMDVPATADVSFGWSDVDWQIQYLPGQGGKVSQHVSRLLAYAEKQRLNVQPSSESSDPNSMSGKVINGAVPGQKLIFGFNDATYYRIYSVIPVGDDLFVQRVVTELPKMEEVAVLNAVALKLRKRAESEVPAGPGACIPGGFVAWNPKFEHFSFSVHLKEFPDVRLLVDAKKNQDYAAEPSSLRDRLDRMSKDENAWHSRVKFLRLGPRQLGNWKGDEALIRHPVLGYGTDSHEFAFVSFGVPHDPIQQQFDIRLDTGMKEYTAGGAKPSLTDAEAIALWDKLIGTIRVRRVQRTKS